MRATSTGRSSGGCRSGRTTCRPRRGLLEPPLKQAWSINTHALIEFPPAIHDGVAYVINKYGNGKAVRLRDRKVLWELKVRPSDKGKPNFVTAPVYYRGIVYGAFLDGTSPPATPRTGKKLWVRNLDAHLESSPLAVGDTLYLGTDTTDLLALRACDGRPRWSFNAPGAIKASPSYHDGRVYVADYQSSMFALDADSGKPLWRTNTSKVPPVRRGRLLLLPRDRLRQRLRRPRRRHRLRLRRKDRQGRVVLRHRRLRLRLPRRRPGPRHPADRLHRRRKRPLLRARRRHRQGRAGSYDVGGPVPGTATVIGHTVYTSSFKTRKTIGFDVLTQEKIFELDAGRLHADHLRRQAASTWSATTSWSGSNRQSAEPAARPTI